MDRRSFLSASLMSGAVLVDATSGATPRGAENRTVDFSGADRLLFSSDHPWVQPQEILNPLRTLKLAAASEAKILSGNARSLFQI